MIRENILKHYVYTNKSEDEIDDKYFNKYIKSFLPSNRQARIIDIGCGNGKFLFKIIKLGYTNSLGIELSKEQIEIAYKVYGIENIICSNAVEYFKQKKEKADFVLLIDVLEHLSFEQSLEILNSINLLLNDDGILFIQVPNAFSLFCGYQYHDITHQSIFSPKSLAQLLNYSGFNHLEKIETFQPIVSFKGLIRRIIFMMAIAPLTKFLFNYSYLSYGDNLITTPNFIIIAKK